MKKLISTIFTSLTGIFLILLIIQCGEGKKKPIVYNPEFSNYISAYTTGVISKTSPVRIRLVRAVDSNVLNKDITEKLFDFSPSISGKAKWADPYTIEFQPGEWLEPGKVYDAEFYIGKIHEVPENLQVFEFQFQTIQQSFEFYSHGMKSYTHTPKLVWFSGAIVSSDVIKNDLIEDVVNASLDGDPVNILWQHETDMLTHNFKIDSIKRLEKDQELIIRWDGNDIGIDVSGSDTIDIPSVNVFKVMEVKVNQQPQQEIVVRFSDPLEKSQELSGLIRLSDNPALNFLIDGNTLRIFPQERQEGQKLLKVNEGIKSFFNRRLSKSYAITISFEQIKPAVSMLGDGVILPNSKGLVIPFKAVNLSAVDVEVIKIYESNLGQFFQVNNYTGDYQLKRVGRPVLRKTIQFKTDKSLDYGKWNTYSLNLTDLIDKDPGAMYRIQMSFRPKYSLYACIDSEDKEYIKVAEEDWDAAENQTTNWDYDSYNYSYYPGGYRWSERDNPCHISYYREDNFPSKNILASDFGIIVKEGAGNKMTAIVSNIITTNPVHGVTVEFYNYQQQMTGKSVTDVNGFAEVNTEGKAYYLVAKKDKHRGYMRVDDATSLSLSKFDVSGQEVRDGLKGYIYGERGVWRPGDSLYLTFILEDKQHRMPENHPVIFEFYDPQGQKQQKNVKTKGINGFYKFYTKTEPGSHTGNWTAKVKVGGAVFTKKIKIETIKPNRLKIKLDFGEKPITVVNRDVTAHLKVKWLTGAIARGLKANIEVTFSQTKTKFDAYNNYIFDDPSKYFYASMETVFNDKINQEGEAEFDIDFPKTENAPGMLKALFSTKVFEESGEFSIDYQSVDYAPYRSFVGLMLPEGDHRGMLMTDTMHTVSVATVDDKGNPISVNNLKAKIYKVEWRWWWDASNSDLAGYFSRSHHKPVYETRFSTTDGSGEFYFKIEYPEWGRYFVQIIDPKSDHSTGATCYIDWPGWAGEPQRGGQDAANMLVFNADKEKYKVGDQCKITFPSSGQGRALVSIESGSRILKAFWVQAQPKSTQFSFDVTADMAPNIYANITLVQPHAQTKNDAPIRMYGVIPVMVENPANILQPEIKMPDELEPNAEVTITVSEKDNKAMTYTLAVVDEGLLDLTHFITPNPYEEFYAREALGVKTWDLYKYVIGAYGGTIEQMFSIGGDGISKGESKHEVNRFKSVVKFFGPFDLIGGKQEHTFKMPNYVGSVRTMVVAGDDGAYGCAQKTTPVRKPLMVLATLPRVLGPEETVELPVTVFAMEDDIKDVSIKFESNEFFELDADSKEITFNQTGDQVVNFKMKVKPQTGVGKVKISAESGSEKASYEIEILIRNPNPPITKTISGVIEPGKSWKADYTLPGIEGTNAATLEVSALPPINLEKRLKFLVRYPYGCAEQTTSSVFPQLYLKKVMEIDSKLAQKISENIKEGIKKIKTMQHANGGIAYWPTSTMTNDWATSYAGHFMLEAEKQGYLLPIGFKESWIRYQKKATDEWQPYHSDYRGYYRQSDLVQAYRLFTLALAGEPKIGAMNRLREYGNIKLQARWVLAAAYVLISQPEAAEDITAKLGTDVEKYTAMSETYGSRLRDRAFILLTMSLMNEKSKAIPIMESIAKNLSSNSWYSTQTTAFCLIAMAEFVGNTDEASKQLTFEYSINNRKTETVNSLLPLYQEDMSPEVLQGNVYVENKGKSMIYGTITMTGIPVIGDETSASNNLGISVSYKDMKGNKVDVSSLEQSMDFIAEVSITNPGTIGYYKDMALSQIFPSGWEITNMRLADAESVYTADKPTYQDIRDDRVYTFFDLPENQSKTFVVLLNATYLGRFYLPAVSCEAMYDNALNARVPGEWVEVYSSEE